MKLIEIFAIVFSVVCVFFVYVSPQITAISSHPPSYQIRQQMSQLRTALILFKADLGKFPFAGTDESDAKAYDNSQDSGMGCAQGANCLASDNVRGFAMMGLEAGDYKSGWKGPYIDYEPKDTMFDLNGNPIIYFAWDKGIYLWSAGEDARFERSIASFSEYLASSNCSTYASDINHESRISDDILMRVARVRRSFSGTPDLNKRIDRAYAVAQAVAAHMKE